MRKHQTVITVEGAIQRRKKSKQRKSKRRRQNISSGGAKSKREAAIGPHSEETNACSIVIGRYDSTDKVAQPIFNHNSFENPVEGYETNETR